MTALTQVRVVEGEARRFGSFDLIAKLGRGGMAEAFLAARVDRPAELLVVKRLTPDFADDVEHRAMFDEESRIMPLFSHPNVVRTFEAGEEHDQKFVAMEFLDGLPLEQCSDELTKLGPAAAVRVISEVLDGLHYVHELRGADGMPLEIVHRDMSPHNVFVTYEGRVTVVDFGIAKMRGRAQHTSTGVVRGKLSYMAPEQALCDIVDRRADVFAVAVMLWELLHGDRFWGQVSEVQILKQMTFGELPHTGDPLLGLRFGGDDQQGDGVGGDEQLANALRGVLRRGLAAKPEDRFASAREFREALAVVPTAAVKRTALGRAVQTSAADFRASLRELVDGYLADARGTADLFPPRSRRDAEETPVSEPARADAEPTDSAIDEDVTSRPAGGVEDVAAIHAFTQTGGASSVDLPAPPATAGRRWLSLGAAALALGGAAWGANAWLSVSPQATVPTKRAAEPTAVASAAPDVVQYTTLTITAAPPEAEVYFDEMRVTQLPFVVKLKKDGVGHTIRAEAPGHLEHSRIVVLDRDTAVHMKLDPLLLPKHLQSARPPTARTVPAQPALPQPTGKPVVDKSDPWGKKK